VGGRKLCVVRFQSMHSVDSLVVAVLGGPVEKMSFFQIAPITKVSTQIHSSMCQYDVYKVSSKKMSGRGPSGVSKSTFFFGGVLSGLGSRNFAGFQVVSTQYTMLMTLYHTPISIMI
jgi:hypothetical protein